MAELVTIHPEIAAGSTSGSAAQSDPRPGDGLKTVTRAVCVLRALSEQSTSGMRLCEIALATRLHKATAYRVLAALIHEGLVEQDQRRRYHLGAETWILGMAAAPRFDIRQLSAPALDRISEVTGDTVFLSIQSGHDAICIDRREGSFPIRTLTLEIGSRRPLGVGAGSLALLAFLSDDEIERTIAANARELARYPRFTPEDLRPLIVETRARGYSFNDGRIVPEMSAVGVPIFDHRGRPVASLSCAAINSRTEPDRRATIVAELLEAAAAIANRLNPRGCERVSGGATRLPGHPQIMKED